MPSTVVTPRGLFWTGVWCVLGAAAATVASAFFPSTLPSICTVSSCKVFSYLVVVVRDISLGHRRLPRPAGPDITPRPQP